MSAAVCIDCECLALLHADREPWCAGCATACRGVLDNPAARVAVALERYGERVRETGNATRAVRRVCVR